MEKKTTWRGIPTLFCLLSVTTLRFGSHVDEIACGKGGEMVYVDVPLGV